MQHIYKQALITGASSGIGEAFARHLPRETDLILTGRNAEKLEQLKNELSAPNRKINIITADLATSEGIETLLLAIQTENIDLFINNAGIGQYGAFADHTLQSEMQMLKLNILAVTHLAHAICPTMATYAQDNNSSAAMVIVSSVAAFMPLPWFTTYSATKAFDLYLAEGLAEEYKNTPLDVMALCPGPTTTNFSVRAGMSADSPPDNNAMTAQAVVNEAINSLGSKRIVVTGLFNKILVQLPRLLPRKLVNRLAGNAVRKTRNI